MDIHAEITELEEVINTSPDNIALRKMLIKKMKPFAQYLDKMESHIQYVLKMNPSDNAMKGALMEVFFQKKKISACIILGEELQTNGSITNAQKVILAKALLEEQNHEQARKLYIEVISEDESFEDEILDRAFRVRNTTEEGIDDMSSFMEKPNIDFSDVGGLDQIKREIDLKIIKPLEHAELYASYGKKVGGGILLYGPPGCGKTYLSRATAGEINAGFINVTLNDILDMWSGNSEKNLHAIFQEARQNGPCILFFDEIDALGAKRSDMRQSAGKHVINQFLTEMDGVEHSNEGVLIIGATNVPWHLDTAFRRPGRFDRIIFVPPPDRNGIESIIKLKLQDKPVGNIDVQKISKKCKHYSGADVNAIIDIATEEVLEKALETGVIQPITTKEILSAVDRHSASTMDWFTTAKNYATFANQSGTYDDIIKYMKQNKL